MSVNKVILVGRLGSDVDLRFMTSGEAVANVSLATSEQWTDKTTKEKCERVEWHKLVAYRRLAEVMGDFLKKGSQIYIEGKLQTRKWEDKDKITRYTTEVIVQELKMLGGGPRDSAEHVDHSTGEIPGKHGPAKPARPAAGNGGFSDMDDDIPF